MRYEANAVTDTLVVSCPGHVGDLAAIRVSTLELGPRLGRHILAALVRVIRPLSWLVY